MFGKKFTYDNHSSEEHSLIIASFEQNTEIPMGLSREILKGEMNRFRTSPNHMGTSYQDVLSFNITVVKNPSNHDSQKELYFTEDEVDEINAWLTSPDYPTLFHMYDYEEETYKKYDYFGLFTDVQTNEVAGYIVGLTYTLTTNSPYAFTNIITKEFECLGETNITINVNTSERKREIYPIIKLLPSGNELGRVNIQIKNVTDNNRVLNLNVLKEPITIDCGKSKIYDSVGLLSFEDLGVSDIDYLYWVKLYHGTNNLVITGDTTITFEYREPRKVGAY